MSEYWIHDGSYTFCDGDQGVDIPNHVAVVKATVANRLADSLRDADNDALCELADVIESCICDGVIDTPMLRTAICDTTDQQNRCGKITDDQVNDPYEWFSQHHDPIEVKLLFADQDDYDARKHACVVWGWIRVQDNHLEFDKLSSTNLKHAADILADIAFDCEVNAMGLATREYYLYSYQDDKIVSGVPYTSLLAGTTNREN